MACNCTHTDAWKCAKESKLHKTLSCPCNCHKYIHDKATEDRAPSGQAEFALLSCKRWHEAEVVALKKCLADENADNSPTAKSMRHNFRCKISQHETFIKGLAAVTT